jgi:hypothetical protein
MAVRAAAAVVLGGLLAALLIHDGARERVNSAQVPGVGIVEGAVRPGTAVRPPANVPRARRMGARGVRALSAAQARAFAEAAPAADAGAADDREAVMDSLKTKVFLLAAARACLRPPPAALAVLDFVFVAPQRRPELENLVTTMRVMRGRERCPPVRLRVDDGKGVRVRGAVATAVLRGALETHEEGDRTPRRHEWRAILRRSGGDWKIAALAAEDLDYAD